MKKIYKILGGVILCIILVSYFLSIKNQYTKNFAKLDMQRLEFKFQDPFVHYFFQHFQCPDKVKDIISHNDAEYDRYLRSSLNDPLSRQNESIINYFPVFNPINLSREGFVILSTGIDGKFDNNKIIDDTLFTTDFIGKLKVYNADSFYKIGDTIERNDEIHFNILNYLFGHKDYLVEYINCIDLYKQSGTFLLTIEELVDYLASSRAENWRLAFKLQNSLKAKKENDSLLVINHGEYIIKCWFNPTYNPNIIMNDSLKIVGIYNGLSENEREIQLYNCIQLK